MLCLPAASEAMSRSGLYKLCLSKCRAMQQWVLYKPWNIVHLSTNKALFIHYLTPLLPYRLLKYQLCANPLTCNPYGVGTSANPGLATGCRT